MVPTFSCRRCLSNFNSRYVRFANTGVLNGFMIFLMATFWLVSWSRAELSNGAHQPMTPAWREPRGGKQNPYQTSPKAPIPTGWRSEYLRRPRQAGSQSVSRRVLPPYIQPRHRQAMSYLDVISNVVPKIWARTNSAMLTTIRLRIRLERCE